MLRVGCWGVVAALATGCLEAPPSSAPTGDGGPPMIDGGATFEFPPDDAEVHLTAVIGADIDGDGRDDLVLLDDDDGDDWVGVYILRAGDAGWMGLDQVALAFEPTAAWFGRRLKAGGAALVVGGSGGEVALVDHKLDMPYDIDLLDFNQPLGGPVTVVHSGIATDGDAYASLVIYDSETLWKSSPVDLAGTMTVEALTNKTVLDAAFWPPSSSGTSDFIAVRSKDEIQWHTDVEGNAEPFPGATAARLDHLVTGICGTHLVVGLDNSLSIGSIDCSGAVAATDELKGSDIPMVTAMVAGDLGGSGGKHDVALIGLEGDELFGQALLDINHVEGAPAYFEPDAMTERVPIAAALLQTAFLAAADVEADGSALVYLVAPSGAIYCAEVKDLKVEGCLPEWQVKGR